MRRQFRKGCKSRRYDRPSSRVRVCEAAAAPRSAARRRALQTIAGRVVSVPAAYVLAGGGNSVRTTSALGRDAGAGGKRRVSPVIRDFADPMIELLRLLREASEIEHALMLQYLYAASSLKPRYQDIVGVGDPNARDLVGIAVQEMQHLGKVNRFLRVLGAAPNLMRQDFPFEPDVYPFAFNLEPLSRRSLAKYVFAEAPREALVRNGRRSQNDVDFIDQLSGVLGANPRANHIGSLYDAILDTMGELTDSATVSPAELDNWRALLLEVKREGEEDHFAFFKALFMGKHEAFDGQGDVWSLPLGHQAYPAEPLPLNPTAYVGHQNEVADPELLELAWLSNLHYWAILQLLTLAYREDDQGYLELAQSHMVGPLWSLMRHLPSRGCGVPFDPLSMGYAPGLGEPENLRFVRHMLDEMRSVEEVVEAHLPTDYPDAMARGTLDELDARRV